jgi:hypothetical protein
MPQALFDYRPSPFPKNSMPCLDSVDVLLASPENRYTNFALGLFAGEPFLNHIGTIDDIP